MKVKIPYSWPNFKFDSDWNLFLDRDGVINERIVGDYVKRWEEFKFLPGVLDALAIFNYSFKHIFIVTNQQGIGKGLYTHEDLYSVHEQMMEYINYHSGRVDEIYYCPYLAVENPLCRKPNPGMALEALRDYPDIDFKKCIMIGDSNSDIGFGNNLGMRTILVGNKAETMTEVPDCHLASLKDFAGYVENI